MKKFSGIYLDKKTSKYYVSTTFMTKDGFEIRKCKRGFDNQRDADKWKQETKIYYASIDIGREQIKKTPTEDMIDEYLKSVKLKVKKTTFQDIKSTLNNHFGAFFKYKLLNNLTPQEIQKYYNELCEKDINTHSKNVILSKIINFLDWLDVMEMIEPDIVRKFKRILVKFDNLTPSKNDFYTVEEINTLINSIDNSTPLLRIEKLFYELCAYGGLRIGEALGIMYEDFDFENNTVRVSKQEQEKPKHEILPYTKTNQIKIVDIPEFILKQVELCKQDAKDDYVFFNVIRRIAIRRLFDNRTKSLGLKRVKIHDLRHSYCTMLYELNADEKYVAKQMGHSTAKTSRLTYEHLTNKVKESNKNNIVNKLDLK